MLFGRCAWESTLNRRAYAPIGQTQERQQGAARLQAEHPEQAGPLAALLVPLSGREHTILRGLAAGRSPAKMAADLVLSANTIKTQVSSLYRKLNAHSREEALAEATRLRLL